MNLTGSGNFSSNQTIGGGPPRGGPPRGFPGGLAEAKIALNMIKYGYAVLTAAFIIGETAFSLLFCCESSFCQEGNVG